MATSAGHLNNDGSFPETFTAFVELLDKYKIRRNVTTQNLFRHEEPYAFHLVNGTAIGVIGLVRRDGEVRFKYRIIPDPSGSKFLIGEEPLSWTKLRDFVDDFYADEIPVEEAS